MNHPGAQERPTASLGRSIDEVGRRLFDPPSHSSHGSGALWVSAGLTLLFSLLMLPYGLAVAEGPDTEPGAWVLGIGFAYVVSYLIFVILGESKAWFVRMLMCALLLVLGGALVTLAGLENAWVLVFALCVITAFSRTVVATGVVLLVVGVLAGVAFFTGEITAVLSDLVLLASVGIAMILFIRLVDANGELRRARDEVAEFAVVKERERVARELHDILGHSLTSITVQAGVLRRVLEHAGHEREARQAGEVEQVARQSLSDVRATVSDYRSVTLAGEIAGAGVVLRSVGIVPRLPRAVDEVSPDAQRVLGYVVREAVTNAVRHSEATVVEIRLDRNGVEVLDNGPGVGRVVKGNGLRGLEERITDQGGELRFGRRPDGGFYVAAALHPEDDFEGGGSAPPEIDGSNE